MRLLLGCQEFASVGGTQTYLLTVAEQLQRLGHDVSVHADHLGEMADFAQGRGIRVHDRRSALPDRCDGMITRDGASAAELALRYPHAPHVFVAPSEVFDFQLPPQLPDVTSVVVALNDRVARRIRALATEHELVRLRQPVNTARFSPRAPLGARPRRVLLLGNYLRGRRRDVLLDACAELSLEVDQVGAHGSRATPEPEADINRADIVVGKARAALDGMACGRAVYIYDAFGGDGWVTPERYPSLEADNFGGLSDAHPRDPATLRRELSDYRPEMGLANRDLVLAHHHAGRHTQALVALLRNRGRRRPPPPEALAEVARLTRLLRQVESRASALELEAQLSAERAEAIERERLRLAGEVKALMLAMEELKATRRYRVGAALAGPIDRIRRRGSRTEQP